MSRRVLALTLALLAPGSLFAQWFDDFADGDITANPPWTGDLDQWGLVPFGPDLALRTLGAPRADTLHLATPSPIVFGTWRATVHWEDGRPSNFNLVRLYLIADTSALEGPVRGYYVQLGSNSRDVRLYRSDPDLSDGRTLLGQSDSDLLDQDTRTLSLEITRAEQGTWTVRIDGVPVLTVDEPPPRLTSGAYFGLWVKHSSTRGESFLFDDVGAEGIDGPSDTSPPALVDVTVPDPTTLDVTFDESTLACTPDHFEVSDGIGAPVGFRECREDGQTTYGLLFATPLLPGRTYTLTVRDIPDVFGNVLDEAVRPFSVPLPPDLPGRGDVVINEILYDPAGGGSEFVELHNRSVRPFDLSTLALSDDRLSPVLASVQPATLAPGGYAVLVEDGSAFAAQFPGVPFFVVASWPALNNGGDAVVLWAGTTVVDSVAYRPSWGGAGVSLERVDPAGPSAYRLNWADSRDPAGGTPGRRNSVFAPDLTPPALRFVDQVGERTLAVSFSEPLDPGSVRPEAFSLSGPPPTTASLSEDLKVVTLTFAAPIAVDRLSVTGVADLTGNVLPTASMPVARWAEPGDLRITEVLYDPLADPFDGKIDQPEYVELYNASDHLVTLTGLFWTDRPDERNRADTLRLGAVEVGVEAGQYAVVFSQPETLPTDAVFTQSRLVLAFPEDYAGAGTRLLPVAGASLGLRNDGDLIRLHRRDGLAVDALEYSPAWHDAALPTTRGVSLEKIAPTGPAQEPTNWTSSAAPAGGTPGLPNSVRLPPEGTRRPEPGDLVLNEILYEPLADAADGLPDQPEFVELFNTTPDPLDLNGLMLTGRVDETGRADTLRFGFGPRVLPPGGFAVVFTNSGDAVATLTGPFPALITALDQGLTLLMPVRRPLGLDNAGDRVAVLGRDGSVLDETTYSPAWHHVNLRDPRGVSLERIDPRGPSTSADNWTSSVAPSGATPGLDNSVRFVPDTPPAAPGLVISPSPFSPDRDGIDDVAGLQYTLKGEAGLLRARIFDAAGRPVRTLVEAALTGRSGTLLWDGLDDDGRTLPIGIYVVLLEAVSAEGGTTEAYKRPVVLARPLN